MSITLEDYKQCQVILKGLMMKKDSLEKEIANIRKYLFSPV